MACPLPMLCQGALTLSLPDSLRLLGLPVKENTIMEPTVLAKHIYSNCAFDQMNVV
jgi:hypothetical protein